MKKLWAINHPYYCNEENYWGKNVLSTYDSWRAFMEEEGDADFDYNLLFRWDWRPPDEDELKHYDNIEEAKADGWKDYHQLKLFWMTQRKGYARTTLVRVTPDDEPAVREWLKERWEHLKRVWAPFGEE